MILKNKSLINHMKVLLSIGNPLKGDDNIGNVVLDKISLKIKKIKALTTPENFVSDLKKFDKIIIIDALDFKGKVGEVRLFNLQELNDVSFSTHSFPMFLLKKLLPKSEIKVIGIQPKNIEFGDMSKELKEKINEITKKVEKIIKTF